MPIKCTNFIIISNGSDPVINKALMDIFNYHHPLEKDYPVGSHVEITLDEDSLMYYLLQHEWTKKKYEAYGIAKVLKEGPNEVLSVEDLCDDGEVKPFVSIMSSEGCLYTIEPKYLKLANPIN